MKISQGWEQGVYALLILGCLPENKSLTALVIAERLKVSPSYLKKIFKSLVDEGLVKSTTGKNGGFSLALPLPDITFLDVFSAIEGRGRIFYSQHLLNNLLGLPESHRVSCPVSSAMNYLEDTIMSTLSATKLSKVLEETRESYDLTGLDDWLGQI